MSSQNLIGQRFGRLVVTGSLRQGGQLICLCDCGKSTSPRRYMLLNGQCKSCGCLRRERILAAITKHGKSAAGASKAYVVWLSMNQRCFNANNRQYHDYGGRGITICERWRNFENFLNDMGEPPAGFDHR